MRNSRLLRLILTASALPGCGEELSGAACVDVPEDATTCPAADEVDLQQAFVPLDCDNLVIRAVSGSGRLVDKPDQDFVDTANPDLACCYDALLLDRSPNVDCVVGRPWMESGRVVLAAVRPGSGWGGRASGRRDPARGAAWAEAGRGEHASIAAFAELALQLLAHGAPADLVRDAFAAGADEVAHASACFGTAAQFGTPVQPAPFPFTRAVDVGRSLADIAVAAVREGCVGETLGAILAGAAAEAAPDRAIRQVFATIAEDEERHAVLAWRIVAWAQQEGGAEVREAVDAAFRAPAPAFDLGEIARRSGVPVDVFRQALTAGLREVVRPAAVRLLAA